MGFSFFRPLFDLRSLLSEICLLPVLFFLNSFFFFLLFVFVVHNLLILVIFICIKCCKGMDEKFSKLTNIR